MKYQRTQIYLDPDDHRKLRQEAAERGISLAALLREIAGAHVREASAPYRSEKSWDAIIGIDDSDEPSDIALHEEDYKRDVGLAMARKVERQIDAAAKRKRGRKPSA
jgi:hypothetical protein